MNPNIGEVPLPHHPPIQRTPIPKPTCNPHFCRKEPLLSQKPRLIRKRIRKSNYSTLCLYLMFVLLTLSVVAS